MAKHKDKIELMNGCYAAWEDTVLTKEITIYQVDTTNNPLFKIDRWPSAICYAASFELTVSGWKELAVMYWQLDNVIPLRFLYG
jgi:hypothetical protein